MYTKFDLWLDYFPLKQIFSSMTLATTGIYACHVTKTKYIYFSLRINVTDKYLSTPVTGNEVICIYCKSRRSMYSNSIGTHSDIKPRSSHEIPIQPRNGKK